MSSRRFTPARSALSRSHQQTRREYSANAKHIRQWRRSHTPLRDVVWKYIHIRQLDALLRGITSELWQYIHTTACNDIPPAKARRIRRCDTTDHRGVWTYLTIRLYHYHALPGKAGITLPAVLKSLGALQALGIVGELTGRKRNRVFNYAPYLKILSEGTEPLAP